MYIIDGNNLAGKLKMLGEANFDKKLIDMIRNFSRGRGPRIILVFDGADRFGDKSAVSEYLSVVYSPKDRFYRSADDKIVELVQNSWSRQTAGDSRNITVVTDDSELGSRIMSAASETRYNIRLERATDWAEKIIKRLYKPEADNILKGNKGGLSDKDMKNISDEMMRLWKE
jgi:predicted RNA-binding protein with PIN domain